MKETKQEIVWLRIPFVVISDSETARNEAIERLLSRSEYQPWSSTTGWTISQSRLHNVAIETSATLSEPTND